MRFDEATECQFWLVWCPAKGVPTKRHGSRESAVNEARRLARANAGAEFFILEAVAKAALRDPVELVGLRPDDGFLPF